MRRKKQIVISTPKEIFSRMKHFELKRGFRPRFILTTPEKRKTIMEWIGHTPEEISRSLGFSVNGIPVITPEEVMIL